MRRIATMVGGLIAWAGAAYAALAVADIPADFGHALCGPWGCSPPPQALLAVHLLWAVAFAPPLIWACRTWPSCRLRKVGWLLIALGVLAVGLLAGREAVTWYQSALPSVRPYFGHRVAFVLATTTDLPVLQLLAAGIVCRVVAGRTARVACSVPA